MISTNTMTVKTSDTYQIILLDIMTTTIDHVILFAAMSPLLHRALKGRKKASEELYRRMVTLFEV